MSDCYCLGFSTNPNCPKHGIPVARSTISALERLLEIQDKDLKQAKALLQRYLDNVEGRCKLVTDVEEFMNEN